MSEPQPLRHQFEREIEELEQRLLDLAQAVESAVGQATKALLSQNEEMAEHVLVGEDSVNQATYEIEDYVNKIVAREQPVATDLRFIITSLHVVIALERIGDLAVLVGLSMLLWLTSLSQGGRIIRAEAGLLGVLYIGYIVVRVGA